MRRMLLVVTVFLVMAATMVTMAMPAFADKGGVPHQGSFGYGSYFRKWCESQGGTYQKMNEAKPVHFKGQACLVRE